jgi:hypothetical protein
MMRRYIFRHYQKITNRTNNKNSPTDINADQSDSKTNNLIEPVIEPVIDPAIESMIDNDSIDNDNHPIGKTENPISMLYMNMRKSKDAEFLDDIDFVKIGTHDLIFTYFELSNLCENSNDIKMNQQPIDHDEKMCNIKRCDTANMVYRSEAMFRALFVKSLKGHPVDNKDMLRRKNFWIQMEENKNKEAEIISYFPVLPLISFIESVQSWGSGRYDLETIHDNVAELSEQSYLQILFLAIHYGTLGLFALDQRIFKIFINILTIDKNYYDALAQMLSILIDTIDVGNIEDGVNPTRNEQGSCDCEPGSGLQVYIPCDIFKDRKRFMKSYNIYTVNDRNIHDMFDNKHHTAFSNLWNYELYHSDLMRHVLTLHIGVECEMKQREELFQFLETNKDSNKEIDIQPNQPFMYLIKSLQSDFVIRTNDDIFYMSVMFFALKYGCLNLMRINYRRIMRILVSMLLSDDLREKIMYFYNIILKIQ